MKKGEKRKKKELLAEQEMEQDSEDEGSLWSRLWVAGTKIRGMGYLISSLGDQPAVPLDLDELWDGIGTILMEIGEEVDAVARLVDRRQVSDAKEKAADEK
jgi:hypothetical protein